MSFPAVTSKNPSKFFSPIQTLTPAARTAAANGLSIDRYQNGGYEGLTLMIVPGNWTDGIHTFIVEESDDATTWTGVQTIDIVGSASFLNLSSAGTANLQRLDYIGRKRYVRVRTTVSGATTGAFYAVLGLLFAPTIYPAS